MLSSTVELKRIYVDGCEKDLGYKSLYSIPSAFTASGVGMKLCFADFAPRAVAFAALITLWRWYS